MSNKITTRDLISDIIDLETQIEYCKNTEEREGLQNELVTVRQAIEKKMKNQVGIPQWVLLLLIQHFLKVLKLK